MKIPNNQEIHQIDKYEYLSSEEILPSDQRRVTEQAKFKIRKSFKKQTKSD